MAQVSNNIQPNYINAITTAALTGTAWGLGEYVLCKKPFVDNSGIIKDTFVKKMEDTLVALKDESIQDTINYQKNIESQIDKFKTNEELMGFIEKKQGDFFSMPESFIKDLKAEFPKYSIDENKVVTKELFRTQGKYYKFFDDTLSACYNEKGRLEHTISKLSQEKFDALKKIIKTERFNSALKSAGVFTVFCALSCSLFEYFLSRKKKN